MKIHLSVILLSAILLLSACGPVPKEGAVSSGTSASVSEPEAIVPAYFGDWAVTACLGTAPTCAMSQEELTFSYGEDSFTAEGITCEFLPGTAYAEDIVTAEGFETACGLAPSELGASASMLLHVTVNIEGNIGQNRLLGRDFFVLGGDSLLIY